MKHIMTFAFIILITQSVIECSIWAQTASDYLILHDIGDYKFITQTKDFITGQPKTILGYSKRVGPGDLAGASHFYLDHDDITYETDYSNRNIKLGVDVQVAQHVGSDSDRWLLHEVEDSYRSSDTDRLGLLTEGAILRRISGNKVYWIGIGGGSFVWLSNNVVIKISYTDLQATKPEPLEVVQAYLQKYPSTIPSTLVLDRAHDEQWIKDEMERRLWLCDKWLTQIGKADLYKILSTVTDDMGVFLDYREKYYGMSGKDDRVALSGYLSAKDETSIRNKLAGYKAWWNANKTKAINLP